MVEKVTIARMIKLNKKKPILIPPEFVENLKPEDSETRWAVIILAPSCGSWTIRTIPTTSPTVIKVSIEWSQFEPETLQELGEVFMRNNIKTLYSTGICFHHEPPCPYEGYMNSDFDSDLTISQEQLKDELAEIKGAHEVEIISIG